MSFSCSVSMCSIQVQLQDGTWICFFLFTVFQPNSFYVLPIKKKKKIRVKAEVCQEAIPIEEVGGFCVFVCFFPLVFLNHKLFVLYLFFILLFPMFICSACLGFWEVSLHLLVCILCECCSTQSALTEVCAPSLACIMLCRLEILLSFLPPLHTLRQSRRIRK